MLGMSYKEDVGDMRHSPSVTLLKHLLNYSKNIKISDPFYKSKILKCEYIETQNNLKDFDLVLLCTAHKQYKDLNANLFQKKAVIIDLNNVLNKNQTIDFKKKLKTFKLGNND